MNDMSNLEKFIIWERPCFPGLVYIGAEACVLPHKKEFGRPWADTLCFFKDGLIRAVWMKGDLVKNGVYIANSFLRAEYFNEKITRYKILTDELFAWFEKIDKIDLTNQSDSNFLLLVKDYNKVFLDWWGFAQVAEPIGAGCEFLLREHKQISPEEMGRLEPLNGSLVEGLKELGYHAVEVDSVGYRSPA